ncbi:MAG: hypothetical protein Q7J27_09435 [Syntrophales bacterium]|nr:hypothetical protein [Syntrophales bacterium]
MMKKLTSRKLVSVLVVVLFLVSFAGAAVSQESQGPITGKIIAIFADTGRVSVQDESGKMYTLTAGSDVDLKDFSVGDQVVVEYTPDGVIRSITKQ